MILIDLQRAVVTLDHKVFLGKMTCLCFETPVSKWFESYPSNRNFFVSVDVFSEAGMLNCGVIQGSILGSFLL